MQGDDIGPAVTRLLRSAGQDDPNQHESHVEALAALGSPAVPSLSKALADDPDENARLLATEALSKMRGPRVVDALLNALQDKSEEVRLQAVTALGVIADRRAVQPLLDHFATDDDRQVRLECLTSLGLIGDPAAVDVLVKGTTDSDYGVRMWAIDALCQMNDAHAPALVIALMTDPDQYVRQHVVESCGDAFNTPEGRVTLIDLAIDADQLIVTVWARRHLVEYLEHNSGGPGLREQMRGAALHGLRGPHAARAALLLGDLGDKAATAPLIKALHDPDPIVRHHAAFLLAKVGDRRGVPALVAALHDPASLVAASAYNSLQWFAEDGDPRAREAVQNYKGKRFSERLPRS
ncbi:MAG: HEAT repeat domain-containing protein [Candidatus Binatia bacterium]